MKTHIPNDQRLAKDVTIIVPTYQRSQFVRRLLGSLDKQGFGGQVTLADSSTPAMFEKTGRYVTELDLGYKVKHLHVPKELGATPAESINLALAAGVEHIETKYAMLTCDDDYPVPATLEACVKMLDGDAGIESVTGDYVNLWLTDDHKYDSSHSFWLEPSIAISQATACERYHHYIENFFHTMFLLTRSGNMAHIVPLETNEITDPHMSADFIWMFMLVLSGPVAHIGQPFILRQRHGENLNTKKILPSSVQTLMSDTWSHDANTFVDVLARRIADIDDITFDEARLETLKGFARFIGDRLSGRSKVWVKDCAELKARHGAYKKWKRSNSRKLYMETVEVLMSFHIDENLKVYEKRVS